MIRNKACISNLVQNKKPNNNIKVDIQKIQGYNIKRIYDSRIRIKKQLSSQKENRSKCQKQKEKEYILLIPNYNVKLKIINLRFYYMGNRKNSTFLILVPIYSSPFNFRLFIYHLPEDCIFFLFSHYFKVKQKHLRLFSKRKNDKTQSIHQLIPPYLILIIYQTFQFLSSGCSSDLNIICIINHQKKSMASKLKWTQQQEALLKQLATTQSKRKWVDIANQINLLYPQRQRTSKQCREKYINHVLYNQRVDSQAWTTDDQHILFEEYLKKGSQWKIISQGMPGKSENAVKNKFYGKIRKLVRRLNSICRQRINRSNKPLRDQSIMRIIDAKIGFQNLPEHLVLQSNSLKVDLLSLAQKDMNCFQLWDLIDQTNVVNLIKKIHKFNINSRYYCSRKRKSGCTKKISIQTQSFLSSQKEQEQQSQQDHEQNENLSRKPLETGGCKSHQFEPIILFSVNSTETSI